MKKVFCRNCEWFNDICFVKGFFKKNKNNDCDYYRRKWWKFWLIKKLNK